MKQEDKYQEEVARKQDEQNFAMVAYRSEININMAQNEANGVGGGGSQPNDSVA